MASALTWLSVSLVGWCALVLGPAMVWAEHALPPIPRPRVASPDTAECPTACATPDLEPADAADVDAFYDRTGICLRFERPDGPQLRTTPLDHAWVLWAVELAEEWHDAYPRGVLEREIDEVRFLATEADRYGEEGGTAWSRAFDVVLRADVDHARALYVMHHETAHVLSFVHDPGEPVWESASGLPYFGVPEGRRARERTGTLRHAGFVSPYARSNAQEDLAEVFALAMTDPQRLHELRSVHERIGEKVELLATWAARIEPGWVLPQER